MRLFNLIGGACAGVCLSQFPEYSQQYVQRLGGAVDALTEVVADFDRSASQVGKTREEALSELTGTEFLQKRQADMTATFSRQARLSQDYDILREADAFARLTAIRNFGDRELMKNAWQDYRPAIPITPDALLMLAGGFLSGFFLFKVIRDIAAATRRRRKNTKTG